MQKDPPAPALPAIRAAVPADVPALRALVHELAAYEKLGQELECTDDRLHDSLFGARPACQVLVGERGGRVVAYAAFFFAFSTFRAQRCLWLEDLYVTPAERGQGLGRALLERVALVALEHGCARLDWAVLDWNEPAIRFYRALGAALVPDFRLCRLDRAGILRLARAGP